jgi:hypothetical protein
MNYQKKKRQKHDIVMPLKDPKVVFSLVILASFDLRKRV